MFRGATFMGDEAVREGLADGYNTLEELRAGYGAVRHQQDKSNLLNFYFYGKVF